MRILVPATGANALAVAEYVIGTAMSLLRGAYASSAEVAAGKWPRAALSNGREIHGKTLGIVVFGGIGRPSGRLARALGMTVVAPNPEVAADPAVWADEGAEPRSLDALIAEVALAQALRGGRLGALRSTCSRRSRFPAARVSC